MKKVLALGVTALCAFGASSAVFATEVTTPGQESIEAKYKISSEFSVTIPTDITFTNANTSVVETVSADNVLLNAGGNLIVSMKSANGKLVNSRDAYIPYSFTIDGATRAVEAEQEYELLSVASGNMEGISKDISFTIGDLSHAALAGFYTDNLTFTIDVNAPLISNDEFIYGTHYSSGYLETDYPYSALKTHNSFIGPQKIKIVVEDPVNGTDSIGYKANISAYHTPYDHDMISGGYVTTLQDIINGETTYDLAALYPTAHYFRVDIMIFSNGLFTTIPETTTINIYSADEKAPVAQRYAGKKIDILGDSITEQASYIQSLRNLTGASAIVNHGISGQKVTEFATRTTSLDADSDLIIVFGGTNDYWHHDTQIGTITDTDSSTFYGALNSIYNALITNHPDADYLFVFPPHQTYGGNGDTYNFGYGTLNDFRLAMQAFTASKNMHFLDLDTIYSWNPTTDTVDGVHPNANGGLKIATAINNYIKVNL